MGSPHPLRHMSTPPLHQGAREDRNIDFNHCAAAVNQSAINPSFVDFDATVSMRRSHTETLWGYW